MIRLTGDLSQLSRFADKLEKATDAKRDILRSLAEESITLTADTFKAQRGPYGGKWKAKKRPDGRAILTGPTGVLRNSWHLSVGHDWFRIAAGVAYAKYHQSGTRKMVARVMLPLKARGIPPKWMRAFRSTVDEALRTLFG